MFNSRPLQRGDLSLGTFRGSLPQRPSHRKPSLLTPQSVHCCFVICHFVFGDSLHTVSIVVIYTIRGGQKAPENTTHSTMQKTDHSENLRFRVCCVFGWSLFPSKRATKPIRKCNTADNTDLQNGQFSVLSGSQASTPKIMPFQISWKSESPLKLQVLSAGTAGSGLILIA